MRRLIEAMGIAAHRCLGIFSTDQGAWFADTVRGGKARSRREVVIKDVFPMWRDEVTVAELAVFAQRTRYVTVVKRSARDAGSSSVGGVGSGGREPRRSCGHQPLAGPSGRDSASTAKVARRRMSRHRVGEGLTELSSRIGNGESMR